jgi:hypothetical protein
MRNWSSGLEIINMMFSAQTCSASQREDTIERIREFAGPGKASIHAYSSLPLGFSVFIFEHRNERGQRVAATALVVKPEND